MNQTINNSSSEIQEETTKHHEEAETIRIIGLILMLVFVVSLIVVTITKFIPIIKRLSQSIVFLLVGMIVGLIILILHYCGVDYVFLEPIHFAYIFQNICLPAIIFTAAFTMKKRNFFKQLLHILLIAFGGCFISSFVIGFGVYGYTFITAKGIELGENNLTLGQSLQFGSALGATDPVAVLALFLELNVDPIIYSLIFGESMLNDAVSIVLFHTFEEVTDTFSFVDFLEVVGFFCLKSIGAALIGIFLGYFSAFLLKRAEKLNFEI